MSWDVRRASESPKRLSRPHVDIAGAALFFGAIFFLMLGLNGVAEQRSITRRPLAVGFLAASASFVLLFLRRQECGGAPPRPGRHTRLSDEYPTCPGAEPLRPFSSGAGGATARP